MSYFEFPNTRTYDSDLGWIIRNLKETINRLNGFIEVNNIRFSDPILWDITNSYAAFTITFSDDGTSYISKQAVPAGVMLTNETYWLPLMQNVGEYNQNVYIFDTVADMVASDKLAIGMYCKTRGFYSANDGGGAYYYIVETETPNEIDILTAGNFYAVLIPDTTINIKQLGAAETVEDCAAIVTRAVNLANTVGKNIYIPEGDYYFKTPVQLYRNGLKINGGSYRTTRFIYNGSAIAGEDPFASPFFVNAFFATEAIQYDYEITDLQFVTQVVVPAVLAINGLTYSKLSHICVTPNANVKYGMWIGSVNQCVFEEFGTCPNMTGNYTAEIEYGVFFTQGKRLSGAGGPVNTNNFFKQIRGEQCTNGVFVAATDNSQFVDIAAEWNSQRNLAVSSNVRRCKFVGLGSEGSPSVYGMQLLGRECFLESGYDVCGFVLGGTDNTIKNMEFDWVNITTNNHTIENSIYSYSGGALTYNQVSQGSVKITNFYNYHTNSYFRPYTRTGITFDSNNNYKNPYNVPLLVFNASGLQEGTTGIQTQESTGTVAVSTQPFVLPAGAQLHSTQTGFSFVPLNVG